MHFTMAFELFANCLYFFISAIYLYMYLFCCLVVLGRCQPERTLWYEAMILRISMYCFNHHTSLISHFILWDVSPYFVSFSSLLAVLMPEFPCRQPFTQKYMSGVRHCYLPFKYIL